MSLEDTVRQVHGLLLENLPLKTNSTPSGWRTFNCAMCTDTRRRAGIIVSGTKINYNCFNCGFKTGWNNSPHLGGKFKELAERLGATEADIHKVKLHLLKAGDQLNSELLEDYTFNYGRFNTVKLPDEATYIDDLPEDHEVVQYAKARGILGLYPLMHFDNKIFQHRLVVPFTYNGDLIGWTGRLVTVADKKIPKYFHNLPKGGYVFNVDRFINSNRKTVIITEGVFDAILLDGISVLGNTVSPEQAQLIDKLNMDVIVCPDRDTAGKKLIQQAVSYGWSVSFPPWEDCKDAADACVKYGRLATLNSIISHATNNTTKIQVKAKFL